MHARPRVPRGHERSAESVRNRHDPSKRPALSHSRRCNLASLAPSRSSAPQRTWANSSSRNLGDNRRDDHGGFALFMSRLFTRLPMGILLRLTARNGESMTASTLWSARGQYTSSEGQGGLLMRPVRTWPIFFPVTRRFLPRKEPFPIENVGQARWSCLKVKNQQNKIAPKFESAGFKPPIG